ncbi:MAG: hypothetical protein J1E02_05020 [Coprobacter sp.]|nr:hypothetical protein [Coprobacter sp.]
MKKILLTFICCVFSICIFADGPSCPVYGGDGAVATLDQIVVKSDEKGQIRIKVILSKELPNRQTHVLVNVKDADTRQFVKTELILINFNATRNGTYGSLYGNTGDYLANHSYILSINNASCQQ